MMLDCSYVFRENNKLIFHSLFSRCVCFVQVSDAMRQHTKQLCYGLVYGMALRTLASEMDIDEGRAGAMVDGFHRTFPGVQAYVTRCVEQCRSCGYVTTLMGRRRYLPEINSHNKSQRGELVQNSM